MFKVKPVPFTLSLGNRRQGSVGPLKEKVRSALCYSGLPKQLLCQQGFFV